MNRFDFYKENYHRELENRFSIVNSLSIPIGIISAVIAAIFYLITTFDYDYEPILSIFFIIVTGIATYMLVRSIWSLIESYTGLAITYTYKALADDNLLEAYYQDLKQHYLTNPAIPDNTESDFENYLISEMTTYTGNNQVNNKLKNELRYNCEKFLIITILWLAGSLICFGFNYGLKGDKKPVYNIKIDSTSVKLDSLTFNVNINSKENSTFVEQIFKKIDYVKDKPSDTTYTPNRQCTRSRGSKATSKTAATKRSGN